MNREHRLALGALGARARSGRLGAVDWPLALAVTAAVGLALGGAQQSLGVPTRLVEWAGGAFLAWSVVYWAAWGARGGSVYARVAAWLVPWALAIAVVLAVVWQVDRGGWLWYRLTGYNVTIAEALGDRAGLTRADFLRRNPAFAAVPGDPAAVRLPAGEHDFAASVVIPRRTALVIEPGAVLRFGAGRSLVAYGPVTARGTDQRPIVFTARAKWLKWGSVGVIDAGPSVFEHVRFAHARQARVDGIDLVGGLSLIRADAEIAHGEFGPMFGKDALYVRDAGVRIHDTTVSDAFKDGLDFDGGGGVVRDNRFVDCGDEGIDLSGRLDVRVFDNTILDARGGRVAADDGALETELVLRNTLGYSPDALTHP